MRHWNVCRLKLLAAASLAVATATLAASATATAAPAPAPVDVGTTQIVSARYFESYAGRFLVVQARDAAASSLEMSWFDDGSQTPAGTTTMTRDTDAGVYLRDRVLVPVDSRPDHVLVRRDAEDYSTAPVSDWATPAAAHPAGYQDQFVDDYLDPQEIYDRLSSLSAEFPNIAQTIDLPNRTNGYQRRAQAILGTDADGTTSAPAGLAASQAVVVTTRDFGWRLGAGVTVGFHDPGVPNSPLNVSTNGGFVTVDLATDATGALVSTAAQVSVAIASSPVVTATTFRGDAGTGIVLPTVPGGVRLSDGLQAPASYPDGPQTVVALRIGHADPAQPGVLITAGESGADRVPPLVALELAERLLRNNATDPDTTRLVDGLDIIIAPQLNPDGAAYDLYDRLDAASAGKNMTSYCPSGQGDDPTARDTWGVDLDHNFSIGSFFDGYAGGSNSCTADDFTGPFEFSEPETRNVQWLLSTYANIRYAADLHAAGGGAVTWSPGAYRASGRLTLPHPEPGRLQLYQQLAGAIAGAVATDRGTVLLPTDVGAGVDVLGSIPGNLRDDAYYNHGIAALRVDVGEDRMDADGDRTPVGVRPAFDAEGAGQVREFADGLGALLDGVLAQAGDDTPPDVTVTPDGGASPGPVDVRFVSDEPATIHYTLDGSTPTLGSPVYAAADPLDPPRALHLTADTTVRWLADDPAGNVSAVRSASFNVDAAPPSLSASPASLSFGDLDVGSTSAAQLLTIANDGELPAAIGAIGATDADAGEVAVSDDGCSSDALAAGASCTLSVQVTPSRTGALDAALSVPSDAPDGPLVVALSANGTAPTPPDRGGGETPSPGDRGGETPPPADRGGETPPADRGGETPPPPLPLIGGPPPMPLPLAAPTPLVADAETNVRCVGSGRDAGRDVRLSYTLRSPARVTFTLQRRIPAGAAFHRCPKPAPAAQGEGTSTVRYDGRILFASPHASVRRRPGARRHATARAAAAAGGRRPARPRAVARTLSLTAGHHTVSLLRALRAPGIAAGRYRVVIRAVPADGGPSQTTIVYLRVLASG